MSGVIGVMVGAVIFGTAGFVFGLIVGEDMERRYIMSCMRKDPHGLCEDCRHAYREEGEVRDCRLRTEPKWDVEEEEFYCDEWKEVPYEDF